MRRATFGLTLATALAAPSAARAQFAPPRYSVPSGLVLDAYPSKVPPCTVPNCCGGVTLAVSPGTYALDLNTFAFTDAQSLATTWTLGATQGGIVGGVSCGLPLPIPLLDVGGVPAVSTPYYCYMFSVSGSDGVICSQLAPYPNGQPGSAVGLASGIGTDAVFIGSFLTDPNGVFVPMHRVGEQVLLSPQVQPTISTSTGYSFNGGIASCVWPSPPGTCSGPHANSVYPFYPATASAGIFDIHVVSANAPAGGASGAPSLVQFLDPHPLYNMLPSSIQAEISVGGQLSASSAAEVETVRLTLNANQLPTLYSTNDNAVGATNDLGGLVLAMPLPANVVVVAVLRGYVESPQRLYSR